MKNNKGFVVSAVLYPLLVLFLALIMGLLAMTDTRKRILDKMKLEISDSIFDEATCSCDTILNKLNYLIKNGVGGGGGGSYTQNVLGLNVKTYESPVDIPSVGNNSGDIAVITEVEMPDNNYYVSTSAPQSPKNGTIWIVQDRTSKYYITSDYSKIGISYAMQYICDENNSNCEWQIKKAYVQDDAQWKLLYYVSMKDGIVDLTNTDINAEIIKNYAYTGKYQVFQPVFSGYYLIELWGAQGGTADSGGVGGKGSYTRGKIYLDAGVPLYVYVGGTTTTATGGWNGGGNGSNSNTNYPGYGGGGATDVRLVTTSEKNIWNEFDSLKSRIMVAAGGGGGGKRDETSYTIHGGAGGGLIGSTGTSYNGSVGTGGTQIEAGYNKANSSANVGGFGHGGTGTESAAGGGGSGYYGGGASSYWGGGGGGSSYISGYQGCKSVIEESKANNIIPNGSAYHYSNYYFTDTSMQSAVNSGNGKATITLLSLEVKDKDELTTEANDAMNIWYYTHIKKYQVFDVPKNGSYSFQLWGAQGGTADSGGVGGLGGYTYGEIFLQKGTRLYLYVGNQGSGTTGGWNGGGNGSNSNTNYPGYGGGGATDVRINSTSSINLWNETHSLKSRIMVAAGGGGGGKRDETSYTIHGGAGGGLIGSTGTSYNGQIGTGGTQLLPGYNKSSTNSNVGGFGYGGTGTGSAAGGGGSGYYGGGSSGYWGGGGGGSSYISGHKGCVAVTSAGLPKVQTYTTLADSISYTGYKFINTRMVDGQGYEWTTTKSSIVSKMPTYDGTSTMTGNSGDGYAKITYLGQ